MDFEVWEVGVCVWYGMVWQRFLAHLGSHNVWDVGVWDGLCVSMGQFGYRAVACGVELSVAVEGRESGKWLVCFLWMLFCLGEKDF